MGIIDGESYKWEIDEKIKERYYQYKNILPNNINFSSLENYTLIENDKRNKILKNYINNSNDNNFNHLSKIGLLNIYQLNHEDELIIF
jgi:hypothetical protein